MLCLNYNDSHTINCIIACTESPTNGTMILDYLLILELVAYLDFLQGGGDEWKQYNKLSCFEFCVVFTIIIHFVTFFIKSCI